MAAELLELYQQLGQLVWDLFQERATESLLQRLTDHHQMAGDVTIGDHRLEATLSRIDAIKRSIASVLADIQQHPDAPEEPTLLKQLRTRIRN
jgi:hypothetical protein